VNELYSKVRKFSRKLIALNENLDHGRGVCELGKLYNTLMSSKLRSVILIIIIIIIY